jgi:hypothetical protein
MFPPRARLLRRRARGPATVLGLVALACASLAPAARAHHHPHARHFRPYHVCYIFSEHEADGHAGVDGEDAVEGSARHTAAPADARLDDDGGGGAGELAARGPARHGEQRQDASAADHCEECARLIQRDLSLLLEDRIRARLGSPAPPRSVLREKLQAIYRVKLAGRRRDEGPDQAPGGGGGRD